MSSITQSISLLKGYALTWSNWQMEDVVILGTNVLVHQWHTLLQLSMAQGESPKCQMGAGDEYSSLHLWKCHLISQYYQKYTHEN